MNPSQPQPQYYPIEQAPVVVPYYPPLKLVPVQQGMYDAQSSRRNIGDPVEFKSSVTQLPGIRLADTMLPNFDTLLVDPTKEVLHSGVGQKISVRLQFEGCESYAKQKYARTTGRDVPTSRSKLARQVAEVVQSFFDEKADGVDHRGRYKWVRLQNNLENHDKIYFDELYLMQVCHVTTGSLQPQLSALRYVQSYEQLTQSL